MSEYTYSVDPNLVCRLDDQLVDLRETLRFVGSTVKKTGLKTTTEIQVLTDPEKLSKLVAEAHNELKAITETLSHIVDQNL